MFDSIISDLKYKIRTGGFWVRCISLCVILFILVNLTKAFFTFQNGGTPGPLYNDIIHSISLSSDWKHNILFIWVWITHIFLHEGFFHLLWNMLWLYWFAQIVEDFIGRRHAILIFFEAALVGGLFFFLSTQILPWYKNLEIYAQGSSAAVMGLLFAAATISPTYEIRLLFFGNVQIKYIAVIALILDLLFAAQSSNSGGHFAHIGGAFMGWFYIRMLRNGVRMDSVLDLFKKEDPKKLKPKSNSADKASSPPKQISRQGRLDRILEKIKKEGIEKLSPEEHEFLDQFGKE